MSDQTNNKAVLIGLLVWQLIATLLGAFVTYFWFDQFTAVSFLLGGLACVLANFFAFASFLFKRSKQSSQAVFESNAKLMVFRFYMRETIKIVFTLLIFAICILLLKVDILAFIIAYLISAVIVNWLYLLSTSSRQIDVKSSESP
jgi:F0F1-type ATP synthase assembly protein I